MKRVTMILIASIIVGVILTLITGQFLDPFAGIQIDIVEYGAPFAYVSRVIPTRITSYDYVSAIVDVIFWSVIVFFGAWAVARERALN